MILQPADMKCVVRLSFLTPVLALLCGLLLLAPAASAQVTPPGDPRNVQVTPGDNKLTITWQAPSSWGSWNPGGFLLTVDGGPLDHEEILATPGATTTSYEFTGRTFHGSQVPNNGETYTIRIWAFSQLPGSTNINVNTVRYSNLVEVSGTPEEPESSNANLSALTASSAESANGAYSALAIGTFATPTTSYTATVPNVKTHAKLTPTVEDTGKATVTVDGATVSSGSASDAISLNVGANTITVRVTAEDETTTKDYTVTITRQQTPRSTNANLSDLTVSAGDLTFDSATTSYALEVAHDVTSVTLTPTVQDTGKATVTVDGTTVSNGLASNAISLNVGANSITVRVTAEDGTTKDYTVTVTRQQAPLSSNANLSALTVSADDLTFDSATTSYALEVAHDVTSVTLTPTVQDTGKATVTVDGTTVASGSASDAIALSVGANSITVRVTAEDSTTTKDYTVTITRQQAPRSSNANLSALTVSAGDLTFDADTTSYALEVAHDVTSVTLTPTVQDTGKATVTVDGTTVASGSASDAIALSVGANSITVRVTAEDSTTTKDYTVTITRQQAPRSSNANLSALTVSAGDLAFDSATTRYALEVAHDMTSVTLTPTVQDTGKATVTVDGTTVSSGSASDAIALEVGENVITVVVTAEDGSTTITYTVTVTRQLRANLVNISTRAAVGTGDERLIGGFIIRNGPKRVLVQAQGPELANPPASLSNALADPVLTVIRQSDGMELMENDDWEDSQGQEVTEAWGGSPNLTAGSKSAAAILTLQPGNYTAIVSGKDGTTGVALVEVYDLD